MRVKGIKGDFGTVRRPGGARQLTFNRRPLYTYANEKPGQVLCNNVDDWFAVKVRA
jgi:predicted lipoprotein with Yx(FWY)xxD motif